MQPFSTVRYLSTGGKAEEIYRQIPPFEIIASILSHIYACYNTIAFSVTTFGIAGVPLTFS